MGIVIKDWTDDLAQLPFNFGCQISRMSMDGGAYKIINGTCVHEEEHAETPAVCAVGFPYDVADCQAAINSAALSMPSWLLCLHLCPWPLSSSGECDECSSGLLS